MHVPLAQLSVSNSR